MYYTGEQTNTFKAQKGTRTHNNKTILGRVTFHERNKIKLRVGGERGPELEERGQTEPGV